MRLHATLTLEVLLNYLHGERRVAGDDFRGAMDYLHREGELRSEFDD